MIMPSNESPQNEAPSSGSRRADFWLALVFAVAANLVFLGLLVFSVSWRNPPPVPVTAELYTPPAPEPVVPPKSPEPKPLPPPEPPPPPKQVTPPPDVKPPEQPDPEIAIRKKKEEERRKQEAEEAARKKKEAEEKARQEKLEKERLDKEKAAREKVEKERLDREKKEKEEKERREAEQRRLAAEKKAREEAARREAELQDMLAKQAQREALQAALDRWTQSIRIKVKGNLVLPPNIDGNPEAIFLIVQLPTGEVIDAKLQKSSGNAAYDDAVYRAIMKSSPLPKPERADLFQRQLRFVFKPKD